MEITYVLILLTVGIQLAGTSETGKNFHILHVKSFVWLALKNFHGKVKS